MAIRSSKERCFSLLTNRAKGSWAINTSPISKRCAFTLLELLIAVLTISILAALLAAALPGALETSRRASCANNLRQLGAAFFLYAQDHNGGLPMYAPRMDSSISEHWMGSIMPYLDREQEGPQGHLAGGTFMRCPSAKEPNFTYGVNYTGNWPTPIISYGDTYPGSAKIGGLAGSTMLIMDAVEPFVYNPINWTLNNGSQDGYDGLNHDYNCADFKRHGLKINVVFADGSVRAVSLDSWKKNQDRMWGFQ